MAEPTVKVFKIEPTAYLPQFLNAEALRFELDPDGKHGFTVTDITAEVEAADQTEYIAALEQWLAEKCNTTPSAIWWACQKKVKALSAEGD